MIQMASTDLVGESSSMRRVRTLVDRVAATDASVLVIGESGTGKELVAQALHAGSQRAYPRVSSHQLRRDPGNADRVRTLRLREGQLHRRDANPRRHRRAGPRRHVVPGRNLGNADGDPAAAAALPRDPEILPRRRHTGVVHGRAGRRCHQSHAGQRRPGRTGCARTSTTASPSFRSSCHRCASGARTSCNWPNCSSSASTTRAGTAKRFSAGSLDAARRHAWPGNVRELKHAVECAFILADDTVDLGAALGLSAELKTGVPSPRDEGDTLRVRIGSRLSEVERWLIEATLHRYAGNKRRTADVSGLQRKDVV